MASAHAPAWQTEELGEEWPEEEEEAQEENADDDNNISYGTQSVSLTFPLSTHIHTTAEFDHDTGPSSTSYQPVGTFLVREEVAHAPLLPKTPGRNKNMVKDFFTPLPLETMFEPPSPPYQPPSPKPSTSRPSPLSHSIDATSSSQSKGEMEDEILETDMPNMNSFHGRKANMACQFTFSVPRDVASRPTGAVNGAFPLAQSTPNPPVQFAKPVAPLTDPRLRLFQFQYDTYTREHLSALVDSIAVNTPSGTGTTATPTSFSNGLSRVSEVTGSAANMSHLRSSKRLKLSPSSDLCVETSIPQATVARPKLYGKDYVGESRSLMQQIKQARDFSTISTVASGPNNSPSVAQEIPNDKIQDQNGDRNNLSTPLSSRRSSFLSIPAQSGSNPSASSSGTIASKSSAYSSIGYRQKAAALMEQIKGDVKRQKRIFSGESELSHATTQVEENANISLSVGTKNGADGKENLRQLHRRSSSSSKLNSSRSRPSPRKALKRGTEEADLVHNLSRISIQEQRPIVNITLMPQTDVLPAPAPTAPIHDHVQQPLQQLSSLAPPSYPSTSIRLATNEDLNRFVSSSTASGTTLTAGSAPSFVKHPGPAHIRTIAPTDLPSLPDRFGDMLFDKVMMRWVKNTAKATSINQERSSSQVEEVSDDPFGDIESLRDDSRPADDEEEHHLRSGEAVGAPEMSIIEEEQSEIEDEEEMELSNFSTDASAHIVNVMTGVDTDGYEDETTDSEDANDDLHTATQAEINDIDFDSEFEDSPSRHNSIRSVRELVGPSPLRSSTQQQQRSHQPQHQHPHQGQQFLSVQTQIVTQTTTFSTPNRGNSGLASGTPVIKSALKSNSVTPTSALKTSDRRYYQTPLQRLAHRRSVSFSDGKRDGPIQGITASGGAVQSTRSKRIADMLNALEDSDIDDEDDSPSKVSSSERPDELQPLHARRPSNATASSSNSESPRRVFSRTYSSRRGGASPGKSMAKANGTFLTECSFGVAHDRLVEVITDVQPFEPHWEELSAIDLSGAKLESVARLKEFLPRLDALSLNQNDLAWLSGIPASVRTLSVAHIWVAHSLTGITSYSHLLNLENLDISHNDVESLRQLECLRHLRELKADGNKIKSLDGLQRMDGLLKLSVQGNKIQNVDCAQYRWTRLEMLNISHNQLDSVQGLSSLHSLIALNMDMNCLGEFRVHGSLPRLRILRVSGNRLQNLDVGPLPSLRTLYADNNALAGLVKVDRLTKLENLSLRNQSGRGLNLLTRDVRDVKRLYLSGNPLKTDFLVEPCYNLVYLELAACRLTALPEGMARLVPNLRVLNLNYNFLEDVRPLQGLTRLQKLTIIGSRLKNTKPLIRLLQQMPDAEMLDFRMNPCTLGWYLPLLVKDVPGALQPSEGREGKGKTGDREAGAWLELDAKFRRDLPDASYIGRLAYRGLVMGACVRLRMLDGVVVGAKERAKAQRLLEGILGKS
ncbi:L domain-like protein [Pholiota conissans]|uniref:L domain-like protein n=1 Tax=Pholiota conissans TaxID=109636 RepID=A0A9P6D7K3_9AGAR|nr:L domain-like protein [Pholiota conissans]